jgi:hypothetical protein
MLQCCGMLSVPYVLTLCLCCEKLVSLTVVCACDAPDLLVRNVEIVVIRGAMQRNRINADPTVVGDDGNGNNDGRRSDHTHATHISALDFDVDVR